MPKGFLDGYKTYDTSKGFGSTKKWKASFNARMNSDEAKEILAAESDTPHQILGVSNSASKEEIKKAFRALISEWHPDKNPHRIAEAEAMSKKIIAAYTVLK